MTYERRWANYTDYLHDVEYGDTWVSSYNRRRADSLDISWQGATWKEALRLAREGWPEGLERITKQSHMFYGRFSDRMISAEFENDVEGDTVDVSAYLAGEPECMMRWEEHVQEGHGGVIKIVNNIFLSNGVRKEAMVARGSAVCALVDCLERLGKRCEVEMCFCVTGHRYGSRGTPVLDYRVTIKNPQDSLQLDQMAYVLAHPSSTRCIAFGAMEIAPRQVGEACGAGDYCGVPTDPREDRGDIFIGCQSYMEGQWESDSWVENWIREKLVGQGVEFDD